MRLFEGLGAHLRLLWVPHEDSDKHGEVKGDAIIIYDKDEEVALKTLKHEFVDHIYVKDVIDPLVKYINLQKNLIDDLIYERKERIVDKMVEILIEDNPSSK